MPKNIVVFSDGTGQEGGEGNNTNVYKLFNMLEDRTDRQVVFYDRGLGTGLRRLTGKATGMGISKNIRDCYEFIFDNFQSGDKIYLFGFSRGATTVRSLSALLHLVGILPKSRRELIKQAYKIYKIGNDADGKNKTRTDAAEDFVKRHHTMWCNVEFLGVWDTVAALGVPWKPMSVIIDQIRFFQHSFHDLTLSESVVHARHALAIDDERRTFHPEVWNKDIKPEQTMKQVWFAGMHSDVGGGYAEQDLSDIALAWMVNEATSKGLLIWPQHTQILAPDAIGKMHNSREGFLGGLYRRKVRSWDEGHSGTMVLHQSVVDRTDSDKIEYRPWVFNETTNHHVEPWSHDVTNNPSE